VMMLLGLRNPSPGVLTAIDLMVAADRRLA
jgi:hypothetical protein